MSAPAPSHIPPPDRWGDRLPRRLGLWSAVAVLVGSTIGSGIFRTPAIIAARVPQPLPMLAVWVIGGGLALCGALTYAELAALFPRSGGVFVYIREGFGRLPAFLFGWTELVLIRASALGAIATPFAEYLLRSLGYDPQLPQYAGLVHYIAAAAIVVTATLNYVGVRWSAIVLNLTTGAKYGALVLLVLLAFAGGRGDFSHFGASPAGATGTLSAGLFGLALVSVLWAYDGWGDLSFVGGEVRDPERNLPRALIAGTSAIIAIYLLVNAAYLYLLPIGQIARSPLVAADVAQLLVGRLGVGIIAVVVMVATFSTLLGSMLTAPRIFFAMADDGLFFASVARVHPRFHTPSVSILLTGALGVAFVLARTFEQLADQFVVAIFPFYALAAAAVFVLRRRRPDLPRPVRVLGYPVVPLLFVLASLLILGNSLREHPGPTGLAFGIILLGVPVYLWWTRGRATRGAVAR
ncbi:MAG TPA: amino acid permease [Gemmatimonadales bacterium]|nr:amino acid permease [Gemmatimonadales bacterium]